jgi:hypothetical protein
MLAQGPQNKAQNPAHRPPIIFSPSGEFINHPSGYRHFQRKNNIFNRPLQREKGKGKNYYP